MKKIFVTLFALLAIFKVSYAQWSTGSGYIYPTTLTDKLSLGKTSPISTLDVLSTINATNNIGFNLVASGNGAGTTVYGQKITASNTNTASLGGVTGLEINAARNGTTGSGIGIKATVSGGNVSDGTTYGSYPHFGGQFIATGSTATASTATNVKYYGVYGEASSLTAAGESSSLYGSYGKATGLTGMTTYGGYFTASGGTTNYGVYSNGDLGVKGIIATDPNNLNGHRIGRLKIDYSSNGEPLLSSDGSTIRFGQNITLNSTNTAIESGSGNTTGLLLRSTRTNKPIVFSTAPVAGGGYVEAMRITGLGSVGVGTSSPNAQLDVESKTTPQIRASYSSSRYGALSANSVGDLILTSYSGNIGIGTNSPDESLTVNGKIHAKEVRIDTSIPAPDYVFNKDYDLLSLADVKSYIDKNHHLPEVPSAAEVEKNGLKLGEMNLILLKKVEELTLHLIEKDEQLKSQLEVMTDLKTKQKNLENKLEQLLNQSKK